jgi:hypothetical protein
MHHLRDRLTYANVISTIAVFIALGGGAYAAVSSIPGPDGVIHGCYKKRGGSLRLVPAGKRCSRRERSIAFNQTGPRGPRGAGTRGSQGSRGFPGSPGATGAKGEQGPPGPGATTFTTTLAQGSSNVTIATLNNGLNVVGACGASNVSVVLKTASGASNFQGSGTRNEAGAPVAVDANGGSGVESSNATAADVDVIARDSAVGKFARIDVHGSSGSPCTFWGMIIPSG